MIPGAELMVDPSVARCARSSSRSASTTFRRSRAATAATGIRTRTATSRRSRRSTTAPRSWSPSGARRSCAIPRGVGFPQATVFAAGAGCTGSRSGTPPPTGRTIAATVPTCGIWRSMRGCPSRRSATDDSHYPAFDVGDAWTMVRAADRTRAAVVDALRAGMSTRRTDRRSSTWSAMAAPSRSRARRPAMSGSTAAGRTGSACRSGPRGRREDGAILERNDRGLITRARFTPSPDEQSSTRDHRWWRLVVADEDGRRAWSNVV